MAPISTKKLISVRELAAKEIPQIFPLVASINPGLTKAAFTSRLAQMLEHGYRCAGAFSEGKLVGACGMWEGARFWCGPYLEVDNVVVDAALRHSGIGKLLMDFAQKEAKRLKCKLIIADSYTHNTQSHRFYYREGYIIKGFCFVKELKGKL